jgi:hypothetical protein
MAGRGPQTFQKRQKEQQRKEKRELKAARRLQRKQDKLNPDSPDVEGEGEDDLNLDGEQDPDTAADDQPASQ